MLVLGVFLSYLAMHALPCIGEHQHVQPAASVEPLVVATDDHDVAHGAHEHDAAHGADEHPVGEPVPASAPGCHSDQDTPTDPDHEECVALPRTADAGPAAPVAAFALVPMLSFGLRDARYAGRGRRRRRCRGSISLTPYALCVLRR
ncbi:hypothetical protein [Amycolatopsis antarctica]|uniref:hypothetical protein n=1 Tax=Amycolatopsis antarctica TaxID=1854586 RepID=UPI001056105A|nr:hypothetical protein [Amycolatopsis antarctica]